jgi:hypothetical protein
MLFSDATAPVMCRTADRVSRTHGPGFIGLILNSEIGISFRARPSSRPRCIERSRWGSIQRCWNYFVATPIEVRHEVSEDENEGRGRERIFSFGILIEMSLCRGTEKKDSHISINRPGCYKAAEFVPIAAIVVSFDNAGG